MRIVLFLCLIIIGYSSNSQNNPGYLGHKNAITFQAQYKIPLNVKNITLKLERTINENLSIELSGFIINNTFKPKFNVGALYFNTTDGESFPVLELDGTVTYTGHQINLGVNLYQEYYGAIAPYGKHIGAGIYFNQAKITKADINYTMGNNILEAYYRESSLANYSNRNIFGIYLDLGDKRRIADQFFFQYNVVFNVPLRHNYLKLDIPTNNHWDYTEQEMQNKLMLNNFMCISFGLGFLI